MCNNLLALLFSLTCLLPDPQVEGPKVRTKEVRITGTVFRPFGLQSSEREPLAGVEIIVEDVDGEPTPAERDLRFKTDRNGKYKISLAENQVSEIADVAAIKLRFKREGFKDRIRVVRPKPGPTDVYLIDQETELIPMPTGLRLASFGLDESQTIFKAAQRETSRSPFAKDPNIEWEAIPEFYAVPADLHRLKALARELYQGGTNPDFERVYDETRPLILALSDHSLGIAPVRADESLQKIFGDRSGKNLFRVIIPAGKSFIFDDKDISAEELNVRRKVFAILGENLKLLNQENNLDPKLRRSISKYGNVLRGLYEPVFRVVIANDTSQDYILREAVVEVDRVEVYLGEEERGRVPLVGTYDVTIEPKAGRYTSSLLSPPPLVNREDGRGGRNSISINLRLIPNGQYLHSYRMRIRIGADRDGEVITPWFVVDM